jgi:hypothetical protein
MGAGSAPALGLAVAGALAAALAGCPPPSGPPDGGPPPGAVVRVVKAGDGLGTVQSDPPGIDCDTACAEAEHAFAAEVPIVTLTARPARDALFERWSCVASREGEPLAPRAGNATVIEAVDDEEPQGIEVSCTAVFRKLWTLQVFFSGAGSGRIAGTAPAAGGGTRIDCPDKCVAGYFQGDQETLTAIPAAGSVFVEWKLDCAGSAAADVVLDDDKNCEAHFCPEADPACP